MEDRQYDRRCDTGSAFPLRTSTNQPTRSMGSAAVPVLMKSSSYKNLQDEASEKRRRECMSHQLKGPSLPSKSLFLGALGGSKVATASDLPTITGKKPLPKALLPKEARKSSYQSIISGPFAFTSGLSSGLTIGPSLNGMQRRSSVSSCYPLRPGAGRSDRLSNGIDTENRSKENRLQNADDVLWRLSQERARRNSVNTLSPPPTEVTSQISLSRGRSSVGGGGEGGVAVVKQNIDTESIYPMLRMAFGKDENDDDSAVIRRNPGRQQGAGKKERPVSYADPHSFQKMQEDLQTSEYMDYPPSYNPPPEPKQTPFDTYYAIVRSESSSISNKTPVLQENDFENAPNSIPLQTSTRESNNAISEDRARRVPRLSEEVKPQRQDSLTMKLEALSPSTTGLKLRSPTSTKPDEMSRSATETKIKSPLTLKMDALSSSTTKPKIQSPVTMKPKAISTNTTAGSNREDWYSPIPVTPRRVIKSPLLSSGSQERAEILSPAYRTPSTKSKDSPFEDMRQPRSVFSFDIEANPRSVKDSVKHDENESYRNSPEADQNLIAEENNNNTPPELPSSAPPPLPLTSYPSHGRVFHPSGVRHTDLEYNSIPYTIPENSSSKPTTDRTTVEIVPLTLPSSVPPPLPVTPPHTSDPDIFPSGLRQTDLENDSSSDKSPDNWSSNKSTNDSAPTLSCSASPSLPVTSHPTDSPIIPSSWLHQTGLEYSSSSPDTIPEICSNEPTNDESATVETVPPALPSSGPPPLPVTAPPTNAPIIPPSGVHHNDLEHNSSPETDSYSNESVTRSEHEATAERNNDGMEQTESMDRLQRQSLSSEEGLLEGHETKSCPAQNRETLSPTLSDADSGIDSVKLEQKRSCETSMTNEEYQAAVWDEHSETTAGKIDIAVSPVSNDRNIIDITSPNKTLSSVKPASVELQQAIRNESDCVVMPSPGVLPTRIETASERNEELDSIKTITLDKETGASMHLDSQNGEDKSAFSEDDKKASSDDVHLDPVPPSENQMLTVQRELSEKSDAASVGQRKSTTVHIQKGIMGLGFSVQGGKGSAYGDKPVTVKKIFKAGDASVKEVLTVGDELICANGKDLTNCSLHEAWNYLKTLPDGTIDLVIRKASDV